MYRRTKRVDKQIEPEPYWEPPLIRRVITITDFDGPEPVTRSITMMRTERIDTYAVRFGEGKPRRLGWSRTLQLLRKALPRRCISKEY